MKRRGLVPLTFAAYYLFATGVTWIAWIICARVTRVAWILRTRVTGVARVAWICRARIAGVAWILCARITWVTRIVGHHLGGCTKQIDIDFDVIVQLEKDQLRPFDIVIGELQYKTAVNMYEVSGEPRLGIFIFL